jgi:hypothetical protein
MSATEKYADASEPGPAHAGGGREREMPRWTEPPSTQPN